MLLDVNLWIALLDEAHVHNRKARALMKRPGLRIATGPPVENGLLFGEMPRRDTPTRLTSPRAC